MQVLVMGGTRFLGVRTVAALLADGHDVTVVHRGTRRVKWDRRVHEVIGDRNDPETLVAAARVGAEAVVDMSAYGRADTDTVTAALRDVPRLVHVSTLNVYRPSPMLPWPEDTPYGPHQLWGAYAVEKIGCEQLLRQRRPAPLTTVAIRLPLVLGPRNFIPREEFVLNRILDDQVILLPGDGQAIHQYVHIDHAARALAAAVELDQPGFTPYNVASVRCDTSLEGFVEVCAEVANRKARTQTVGGGPTGLDRPTFDTRDCVFPFTNENTIGALDAARDAGLLSPFTDLHDMIQDALRALVDEPGRRTWSRTEAEQEALARTGHP